MGIVRHSGVVADLKVGKQRPLLVIASDQPGAAVPESHPGVSLCSARRNGGGSNGQPLARAIGCPWMPSAGRSVDTYSVLGMVCLPFEVRWDGSYAAATAGLCGDVV